VVSGNVRARPDNSESGAAFFGTDFTMLAVSPRGICRGGVSGKALDRAAQA
jgi:hypothetical protein